MSGPIFVDSSAGLPPACARLVALTARSPRRAVALARRCHEGAGGRPPRDQALAAYMLGYALLCWERLDEAEPLLAQALAGLRGCGEQRLALDVRRAQLYLALLRGEGGAEEWAALAAAYADLGDPLSSARARVGQMTQLNLRELFRESLAIADLARPALAERGAPGDQAWLLRSSGIARLGLGDIALAVGELDAATALFAGLGQRAELPKCWFERARAYEFSGDFAAALAELERAYALALACDLPLRAAFCEKNSGVFAALLGEFDRGIYLSLRAYDRFASFRRADYMAGCDLNLGNIAYYAGLFDLALSAYRRAERVYDQLGWHHMLLVSRRNQALALRAQRQPQASLTLLDDLLGRAEALGDRSEHGEIVMARGQALADLGALDEAMGAFEDAEQIFRDLDFHYSAGESCLERGWIHLQRGDSDGAEACLRSAEGLLRQRPLLRWRIDYGLALCAEARGAPQAALDHYRRASLMVAQMRRSLSNEHASSGLFAQAQRMTERATALAWQERDVALLLELAELQRSLALVAALRETQAREVSLGVAPPDAAPRAGEEPDPGLQAFLERRLRNRRMRPARDDDSGELDLAQMRGALQESFPGGWTLLSYVLCGDDLLIVTMDAAGLSLAATPFDNGLRGLLARAVAPKSRRLTYMGEGLGSPAWPTLDALGERLIPAQVRRRLRPDHRLLIVAGEPLHGLPWASLRADGRWLMERATIQLLPGLLAWRELHRRLPAGGDALAIGVGSFGGRAADLPGARATLDLVEGGWPGRVDRLEDAGARVATLLDRAAGGELRRYSLIHIASHGQLAPSGGLFAHIKLADGDLRYDEIAQLGLDNPLVVLAVCEGAVAEVLPGEELLSLSRAFLRAGARDVIASEWPLYDTTAPPLLALLYRFLADGCDGPTALAGAQRAWLLRRTGDAEFDQLALAPFVWGGLGSLGAGTRPIV